MAWLGELWHRLLFPWKRGQLDRDLDEEMRFHIEVMQMKSGIDSSPDEARRRARIAFGNATLWREICREAWGWSSVERLFQDPHFSPRQGVRRPPGARGGPRAAHAPGAHRKPVARLLRWSAWAAAGLRRRPPAHGGNDPLPLESPERQGH